VIRVEHFTHSFHGRKALSDVSLSIRPGEMVALIGASGSGKSTLLRDIAGIAAGDRNSGRITVMGKVVQQQGRIRRDIRATRSRIAVVFQQFNLVDRLPVLTNVMLGALGRLPLWRTLLHRFPKDVRSLALDSLDRVGIRDKSFQRASTLSGGQQQRAAIARALVQKARVLLADEPIASLDPESSRCVMEILADINTRDGITILVSLHQVEYATRCCPRAVALKDGSVVYDGPSAALTPAFLRAIYGAAGEETGVPDPSSIAQHRPETTPTGFSLPVAM
jgi:phosphonate transport system ATP-binding protein